MSKFLLILFGVPILLVVVAALLIPLLIDEEQLLDIAATALKEETGAVLTVDGEASISIFPRISVDLNDTRIVMPGDQEVDARAKFLAIGLELMPLFSGNIEIGDIVVDGLKAQVKSAPEEPALDTGSLTDEQLDDFYAQRRKELQNAEQAVGQEAIIAVPLALNVRRLLVTNSMLEMVDGETGDRSRLKIISLEAKDLNLDDRAIPLALSLQLEADDESAPIDVDVSGSVSISSNSQILTLDSIEIEVNGVLAEPVKLQTAGSVDLMKQVADLQLELLIGPTRGEGSVRYANFETPKIDADLHLNQFDPALLALAGPDAAAADEGTPKADSDDPGNDPLPLDAIRAIDTRAVLLIDSANFSGHVVEKVQVRLRAVDGIVKLNKLTGKVHGGKLDMKATFNGQHNKAVLNTKGGVEGMKIAKALKAMESEPVATGKANLQWQLKGSGSTSNELVSALNGPIDLLTSDVVLQSLSVEKMLCEAVALINGESLSKKLPEVSRFETLSMKMNMGKGELRLKPLRAELAHVKLQGVGSMDILAQDFSATFTASLSPTLKKLDPACRVNERLSGIDWPVTCEGNIAGDPGEWCGVQSQKIIQDMATKEVQRTVEKEAGRYLEKLFK
ncbi:MAG: AsmA family protein [Halioglobus sp.]